MSDRKHSGWTNYETWAFNLWLSNEEPIYRHFVATSEHLGGSWWRCLLCRGTLKADCPCCEPPRCNCTRARERRDANYRKRWQPAVPIPQEVSR